MKKCSKCQIEKEVKFFNTRNSKTDKLQSYCKKCAKEDRSKRYLLDRENAIANQRRINIFNKYGITEKEYNTMLELQNGKCAICGSKEIKRKGAKYFNIDHCHKSNKVRGLLCHNCNIVLGKIEDSKEWLKQALIYLS
jgi:hypothetical protein